MKYSEVWVNQDLREVVEKAAESLIVEEVFEEDFYAWGLVGSGETLHGFRKLVDYPDDDHMRGWRPICNIGVRHGIVDSYAHVMGFQRGDDETFWSHVTCKVCHSRKHKV